MLWRFLKLFKAFTLVKFVLLQVFFPLPVDSGHILSWDAIITYQNAKMATKFTFHFSLTTSISGSDYLKMVFPFSLGDYPCASLIEIYSNNRKLFASQQPSKVEFTATNFTYTWSALVSLYSGVWYQLVVEISNPMSQSPGLYNPIEFYTVSSRSDHPIVYDSNPGFSTIALADIPSSKLTVQEFLGSDSAINIAEPGAERNYVLDITPMQDSYFGGKFIITVQPNSKLNMTDFHFIGCNSISYSCPPGVLGCSNIPQVPSSLCLASSDGTQLIFNHQTPIKANETFRLKILIMNPKYISDNCELQVLFVSLEGNMVFAISKLTTSLMTQPLQFSFSLLTYLWGLEKNNEHCPIGLYSGKSLKRIFNTIKVEFKLAANSPNNQNLNIEFSLKGVLAVLLGSIFHNFPNHPDKKVKCQQSDSTLLNQIKIQCVHVGNLFQGNNYFFQMKIVMNNSISSSDIKDFISFQIFTSCESGKLFIPLSQSKIPEGASNPLLINNEDYLDLEGFHSEENRKIIGQNQLLTWPNDKIFDYEASESLLNPKTSSPNIIFDSTKKGPYKLIILLSAQSEKICGNQSNCGTTSPNPNQVLLKMIINEKAFTPFTTSQMNGGIEILGGAFGYCYEKSSCTNRGLQSPLSTLNYFSKRLSTDNTTYSQTVRDYLQLTFSCNSLPNNNECHNLPSRDPLKKEFSAIAINDLIFSDSFKFSSIFPENLSSDMLICFKYKNFSTKIGLNESEFTIASSGLLSFFALSGVSPRKLKVAFVNYYIDQGSYGIGKNNGDQIPMFLRFSGTFGSDSIVDTNKIAIYFDSHIKIDKYAINEELERYPREVSCGGSGLAEGATCFSYPKIYINSKVNFADVNGNPDAWNLQQHIEVTFKNNILADDPFSLLIPLDIWEKTTELWPRSLHFAFLKTNIHYPSLFTKEKVYRIYGSPLSFDTRYTSIHPNLSSNPNTTWDNETQWSGEWPGRDTCLPLKMGIPQNTLNNLYPYKRFDNDFKILSKFEGPCNIEKNNDSLWGSGFTISSIKENIFQFGEITWTGGLNNPCVKLNYLNQRPDRIYSIFCPNDQEAGNNISVAGKSPENQSVTIMKFQVPWYWGEGFDLKERLNYAWSDTNGQLTAFQKEIYLNINISNVTNCPLANVKYVINRTRQEVTLQFTSLVPLHLENSPDLRELYLEIIFFKSWPFGFNLSSKDCFLNGYTEQVKCNLEKVGNDTLYITLSISDSINAVKIFEGDRSISIFITHTGTGSKNENFPFRLNVLSPSGLGKTVIEYCKGTSNEANFIMLSENSSFQGGLLVNNINFNPVVGCYSDVSFDIYLLQMKFLRDSWLRVNLAALFPIENTALSCQITSSYPYDTPQYFWESLDLEDSKRIILTPKRDLINEKYYHFKCGKTVTKEIDGSNAILIAELRAQNESFASYQLAREDAQSLFSHTKYLNIPNHTNFELDSTEFQAKGLDANYIFSIQFNQSYPSGSKLSFVFEGQAFSPLLNNREGRLTCYIDSIIITPCFAVDSKTIEILIFLELKELVNYKIKIIGVSQNQKEYSSASSTSFDNNFFVWSSIRNDALSPFTLEQGKLGIFSELDPKKTFKLITIRHVSISNLFVREYADYNFSLTISSTVLAQATELVIVFPPAFSLELVLEPNFTCSIYQERDDFDLADLCFSYDVDKIIIKLLSKNISLITNDMFIVVIRNLSNPHVIETANHRHFLIFLMCNNYNNITARTASGLVNFDFFMFSANPLKSLPIWTTQAKLIENGLIVYEDLFITKLELRLYENQLFNISFNVSIDDIHSFLKISSSLQVKVGTLGVDTFLAADSLLVKGGKYLINFMKGFDFDWNSDLSPLQVIVKRESCTLKTQFEEYYVLRDGLSFPIIVDFTPCLPLKDLSIVADLICDEPKTLLHFQILGPATFDISSNTPRAVFQIRHLLIEGEEALDAINVKITFNLSGSNAAVYNKIPSASLKVLPPLGASSSFTDGNTVFITKSSDSLGRKTIVEYACLQPSIIFYQLGPAESMADADWTEIAAKTNFFQYNEVRNFNDSSDLVISGFEILQDNISSVTKTFLGLRAFTNYTLSYYCINRFNISIQHSTTFWSESTITGAFLKLTIYFANQTLTRPQKYNIVCVFLSVFKLRSSQISSDEAVECETYGNSQTRLLQESIPDSVEANNQENLTLESPYVNLDNSSKFTLHFEPDLSSKEDLSYLSIQNFFYKTFSTMEQTLEYLNTKIFPLTSFNSPFNATGFPKAISFSLTSNNIEEVLSDVPFFSLINQPIIFPTLDGFDVLLINEQTSRILFFAVSAVENIDQNLSPKLFRKSFGYSMFVYEKVFYLETGAVFNITIKDLEPNKFYTLIFMLSNEYPTTSSPLSQILFRKYSTLNKNENPDLRKKSLVLAICLGIGVPLIILFIILTNQYIKGVFPSKKCPTLFQYEDETTGEHDKEVVLKVNVKNDSQAEEEEDFSKTAFYHLITDSRPLKARIGLWNTEAMKRAQSELLAFLENVSFENIDLAKGNVKMLERISTGPFYDLFHAQLLGQDKILKFFSHENIEDKIKEFIYEAECLNTLKSVNILEFKGVVYHVEEHNLQVGLLHEFLATTLEVTMESGILGRKQKYTIAKEIISGIVDLHSLGIVHGNLQPDNIYLDENLNIIKILPPELSKKQVKKDNLLIEFKKSNQNDNYIPPEILDESDLSLTMAQDTWQLGIVLHEIFYYDNPCFPWKEEMMNYEETLERLQTEKAGERNEGKNKYSKKDPEDYYEIFTDFIESCLAMLPENRPSLNDMQNILVSIKEYMGRITFK